MASARTGIKRNPPSLFQNLNKMNGFPNIPYTKIFEALCIPMRKLADIILGMVRYG